MSAKFALIKDELGRIFVMLAIVLHIFYVEEIEALLSFQESGALQITTPTGSREY